MDEITFEKMMDASREHRERITELADLLCLQNCHDFRSTLTKQDDDIFKKQIRCTHCGIEMKADKSYPRTSYYFFKDYFKKLMGKTILLEVGELDEKK